MNTYKKSNIFFVAHWSSLLFIVALFVIYPFYMENGYYGIDAVKNELLMIICIAGLILLILAAFVQCLIIKIPLQVKLRPSATDRWVLIYSVLTVISSLASIQRYTAWHGIRGWYIGGILILLMNGIYFVISRFWRGDRLAIPFILTGSFLVFLLGLLNRFSIWPFEIPGSYTNFNFISTIGNIGWYNGYMSVVATVGLSIFVLGHNIKRYERILLGIYTFIVFMTALSQGGDTIFIYFLVMFCGLLALSTIFNGGIVRWLEMFMLWALSGQVLRILRSMDDEWFNYDSNNLLNQLNNKYYTLWMFIAAFVIYCLVRKYGVSKPVNRIIRFLPWLLLLSIILYGVASYIYTNLLGVEAPQKIVGGETAVKDIIRQVLYFDEHWGSDRGASIIAGIKTYSSLPWYRKLIGVGPDCFSIYTRGDEVISSYIQSFFGKGLLGNTHCEPLTTLINIGLLGTIAYYGIWTSFLYRCYKLWKEDTALIWIAMSVVCYLSYNLLNYVQIFNYPCMFVLLAMGEAYLKQAQIRIKQREETDVQ